MTVYPIKGIMQWAGQNGGIVFLLGFAAAILVGLVYLIRWMDENRGPEQYEETELNEMILPELKGLVRGFGIKKKADLYRDKERIGQIYRQVDFSEKGLHDVGQNNETLPFKSSDLDKDVEGFWEATDLSYEDIKNITEEDVAPHWLWEVRPAAILKRIMWGVTDNLLGTTWFTRFMLWPKLWVQSYGDKVFINRSAQIRKIAGLWLPTTYETFGVLNSAVMRKLYEGALQDHANYRERLNFYAPQFTQRIQEIEAEAKAEREKYKRGEA